MSCMSKVVLFICNNFLILIWTLDLRKISLVLAFRFISFKIENHAWLLNYIMWLPILTRLKRMHSNLLFVLKVNCFFFSLNRCLKRGTVESISTTLYMQIGWLSHFDHIMIKTLTFPVACHMNTCSGPVTFLTRWHINN